MAKKKMKDNEVNVYSVEGKVVKTIELPEVFMTSIRTDLIRRAVVSAQANRRQSYGPNPRSGMRHAVSTWGKGRGVSRVQRMTGQRTAAESPGTVGGRKAHPPRPDHDWSKKINKKEKKAALHSAIAALCKQDLVGKRHVLGKEIYSQTLGARKTRIGLGMLQKGIYLYNIYSNNIRQTGKLILH